MGQEGAKLALPAQGILGREKSERESPSPGFSARARRASLAEVRSKQSGPWPLGTPCPWVTFHGQAEGSYSPLSNGTELESRWTFGQSYYFFKL